MVDASNPLAAMEWIDFKDDGATHPAWGADEPAAALAESSSAQAAAPSSARADSSSAAAADAGYDNMPIAALAATAEHLDAAATDDEAEAKGEHGPVHLKFNVGVFNNGSLRRHGEKIYAKNCYNLPIFLGLCMETTDEHLAQFAPLSIWRPASKDEPLKQPPQGFCAEGEVESRVQLWAASTLFDGLAVVGRHSRAKSFETLESWNQQVHQTFENMHEYMYMTCDETYTTVNM